MTTLVFVGVICYFFLLNIYSSPFLWRTSLPCLQSVHGFRRGWPTSQLQGSTRGQSGSISYSSDTVLSARLSWWLRLAWWDSVLGLLEKRRSLSTWNNSSKSNGLWGCLRPLGEGLLENDVNREDGGTERDRETEREQKIKIEIKLGKREKDRKRERKL